VRIGSVGEFSRRQGLQALCAGRRGRLWDERDAIAETRQAQIVEAGEAIGAGVTGGATPGTAAGCERDEWRERKSRLILLKGLLLPSDHGDDVGHRIARYSHNDLSFLVPSARRKA
jgi:hypothetical protein